MNSLAFARPYVVSWNLTYRCNLACEHCYLDAGPKPAVGTDNFADRSELGTEECYKVIDEIVAFAPECLTILTGGEPLLRRDILDIVARAAERGLWVVVGTNGVKVTENVARRLSGAGARGLSLSLDALAGERRDSDGDGTQDLDELRAGTDPNQGAECACSTQVLPEYGWCSVASAGDRSGPVLVFLWILTRLRRRKA